MSYSVKLSPRAVNTYQKLDPSIRPRIQSALDALQRSPLVGPQVKRLKGRLRDYLRYRVGDYRIIYTVAQSEQVVYVEYIQHRKDVYRHLE